MSQSRRKCLVFNNYVTYSMNYKWAHVARYPLNVLTEQIFIVQFFSLVAEDLIRTSFSSGSSRNANKWNLDFIFFFLPAVNQLHLYSKLWVWGGKSKTKKGTEELRLLIKLLPEVLEGLLSYGENSHGLRGFCSRDAYVTTKLLGLVALLEIKRAVFQAVLLYWKV